MQERRRTTGSHEAAVTTGTQAAIDRLFVYGTLRTGQTARTFIANSVLRSVTATASGVLYVFPMGYPAFVEGKGAVFGELLWLEDLAATLAMLDAYEGNDFVRMVHQVTLPDGIGADGQANPQASRVKVWAWVYTLADPSTAALAEQITDGDWLRYWRDAT